jgi:hypothetical protein
MGRRTIILFFLTSCLFNHNIKGQVLKNTRYDIEASAFLSTSDQLPFLIRSNQSGEVPLRSQFFQLSIEAHKEYDSLYTRNGDLNKFSFGYGSRAVVNVGKVNEFKLTEGYLSVRFKALDFYIGRKRETFGLVDSSLSLGSYVWSSNAQPLPKAQISTPSYIQVFKGRAIYLKLGMAHGWFGSSGRTKDFFLHQKWIYGRIGKPKSKLKLYGGLNHNVQWGGYDPIGNISYPNNFYAFFYSVLPLKKISKRAAKGFTIQDKLNRVGNHLGSIDLAIKKEFSKFSIYIYRQSFYEQGGALLRLANIEDGLNGLSVSFKGKTNDLRLNQLNFEFFYSKDQGRTPFFSKKNVNYELENYFIHNLYKDGWSYKGNIIGTPLITTEETTKANLPNFNLFINNNRVKSFQLSIEMNYKNWYNLEFRSVYSSNNGILGSNRIPVLSESTNYSQFSFLFQNSFQLNKNQSLRVTLSCDKGELYHNSLGLRLSYQKRM